MLLDATLRESVQSRLAAFQVRRVPRGPLHAAAVALAIVEEGLGARIDGLAPPAGWSREAALVLTRRALSLNRHAGQWALPGGRIDPGESPEQAALRELREEVGLDLPPDAILGTVDDFVTRSGFLITPVVVWGGRAADLVANAAEVAAIHRIRLAEFQRADAPLLEPSEEAGREILRMPVGDGWIAAPTAALVYQFIEVALAGRPTRVAHFDQPLFARR